MKHSSNIQNITSISSGESEYYGITKAAAVGLGLRSLLADWGIECKLVIASDSAAAIGTTSRRGLGKLRHVQTRFLWTQERLLHGDFVLEKVPGEQNTADILTKAVAEALCMRHVEQLGLHFRHGRSGMAKDVLNT